MILLPNGCRCSPLTVFPKNWQSARPDISRPWRIIYRFYDPAFAKPKQVAIRGMNEYKNISDRRAVTKVLLETEHDLLVNKGYNPFHKQCREVVDSSADIDPYTPFIQALRSALSKLNVTDHTREDISSVIKYVNKAALSLGMQRVPIKEIKKKNIRQILDHLAKTKERWSANQFNHYRKYMSILFRELCEQDAVDYNPIRDIAKQKNISRIRLQLTGPQRKSVDEHLKKDHYNFWRFMQIFFHSGSRESELLRMRVSDVNIKEQEFKITVLKGRHQAEKIKPIKTIVLELWKQILEEGDPDQFLFSKFLRPGDHPINPKQISRRWKTHVKNGGLGIQADFYSLKHTNLDETAALLSLQDAAAMASHSTPVITMTYATGEMKRQRDKLKEVKNTFS